MDLEAPLQPPKDCHLPSGWIGFIRAATRTHHPGRGTECSACAGCLSTRGNTGSMALIAPSCFHSRCLLRKRHAAGKVLSRACCRNDGSEVWVDRLRRRFRRRCRYGRDRSLGLVPCCGAPIRGVRLAACHPSLPLDAVTSPPTHGLPGTNVKAAAGAATGFGLVCNERGDDPTRSTSGSRCSRRVVGLRASGLRPNAKDRWQPEEAAPAREH